MAEPVKLQFRPGIVRESTEYANTGGWFDCDKVRFRNGLPEKFRGWQRLSDNQFLGTARSIHAWATLIGEQLYGVGTNLKYYANRGGEFIDITPIRDTKTLGTDPFDVTSGSDLVTVNDAAHGAFPNDFVTYSGATGPIGGIPASDLNQEHQIVELDSSDPGNAYVIQVATTASGTASGGGSSVSAEYQINTGLDTTVFGLGWGADTWGAGGWGDEGSELAVGDVLRLWHQDNFGEDLIFNVRGGGIYYKDVSTISDRGVALSSLAGAENVPETATQVMVSNNDRHVIAFGTTDIGSSVFDPLLIRWSNQENAVNWTQTGTLASGAAPTAGSLRLNIGSRIIRALETQREILVWTDVSLHSFRFLGAGELVFGQTTVGTNISLIAPNSVVSNGTSTYWMGQGKFYVYTGQVQELPCDVEDLVFSDLNTAQLEKVFAGVNRSDNEIIWFIPYAGEDENSFYVVFNYQDNIWYHGYWERTIWLDRQFEPNPLAASTMGYLLAHEIGNDNGEVQPSQAIEAFIRSSEFEIGDGASVMRTTKLIPDVTFEQSTGASPSMTITLTPTDYPGSATRTADASTVTRSSTVTVEQFTSFTQPRVRSRGVSLELRSTDLGVGWRYGVSRLFVKPDGKSP